MKGLIRAYWKELHAMGKTARCFLSVGSVLFSTFLFAALLLAVFSLSGSSIPWDPGVGNAFSWLGRGAVLSFGVSYISDYLFRQ